MTPDARVERMIDLMEKLSDVLYNENEIIEDGKFNAMEKIVSEKAVLMENYEFHIKYLEENPNMLLDASPELVETLIGVGEELDLVSDKNEKLLRGADEAGQMIIASIAEAAASTSNKAKGYQRNGNHQEKGEQIAIAVDEKL